ncbi:hypothetical protein ACF1BB_27780 [Streptomyces griseoluteus]
MTRSHRRRHEHVHKNTAPYRVRMAEEILGHPLTESRRDTEAGLLA